MQSNYESLKKKSSEEFFNQTLCIIRKQKTAKSSGGVA